ncbi:MAG: hypothetical protein K9J21_08110 [Bacteroidales bacterium]|nr:hypothetical protein [Bacteroidales bacterium]
MRAVITSIFLILILNTTLKGQEERTNNGFLIGGSMGLQFGTISFVDVSPKAGYYITDNFVAGLGGTYKYYNDKRFQGDYSTSIYGGRLFLQYDVFDPLYGYGELEYLSYEGYNSRGNIVTIGSTNILLGAGYKNRISSGSYIYLMLLYNINETIKTPYNNPVLRTGFMWNIPKDLF